MHYVSTSAVINAQASASLSHDGRVFGCDGHDFGETRFTPF
jgi:hypothetical protein